MKKQYRAELKALRRAENKLGRDCVAACRAADKRLEREKKVWRSTVAKAARTCDRALQKINRRIAILEGRLS